MTSSSSKVMDKSSNKEYFVHKLHKSKIRAVEDHNKVRTRSPSSVMADYTPRKLQSKRDRYSMSLPREDSKTDSANFSSENLTCGFMDAISTTSEERNLDEVGHFLLISIYNTLTIFILLERY